MSYLNSYYGASLNTMLLHITVRTVWDYLLYFSILNEPRREKTGFFAYAKTKTQFSFAVTAKLISGFVFATRIVQSLFFLNPKFQASSHLVWLTSPVCVGPGRNPRRPVFLERGSNYKLTSCGQWVAMVVTVFVQFTANVPISARQGLFRKINVYKRILSGRHLSVLHARYQLNV